MEGAASNDLASPATSLGSQLGVAPREQTRRAQRRIAWSSRPGWQRV